MNYILDYCKTQKPALIYFAIGCATNPEQQCPSFVSEWPGKKICILMDPLLESPPNYFKNNGIHSNADMAVTGNTIFFIKRKYFETPFISPIPGFSKDPQLSADDMKFLYGLCNLTCSTTRLIVQDYSGRNISEFYPDNPTKEILDNILFDVTYNEGGCFIDFTKVQIQRRSDGSFIHPEFEPLANLRSSKLLPVMQKKRKSPLCYFIHRLYQSLIGAKEARDWCSPTKILEHMKPLCQIYKTPWKADKDSIHTLLKVALTDFCLSADQYLSDSDMDEIIEKPDQYTETINMLCLEEI